MTFCIVSNKHGKWQKGKFRYNIISRKILPWFHLFFLWKSVDLFFFRLTWIFSLMNLLKWNFEWIISIGIILAASPISDDWLSQSPVSVVFVVIISAARYESSVHSVSLIKLDVFLAINFCLFVFFLCFYSKNHPVINNLQIFQQQKKKIPNATNSFGIGAFIFCIRSEANKIQRRNYKISHFNSLNCG